MYTLLRRIRMKSEDVFLALVPFLISLPLVGGLLGRAEKTMTYRWFVC